MISNLMIDFIKDNKLKLALICLAILFSLYFAISPSSLLPWGKMEQVNKVTKVDKIEGRLQKIKRILFTISDENDTVISDTLLQHFNETLFEVKTVAVPVKNNLCQSIAQGIVDDTFDFLFPLIILKIDKQFDLTKFVEQNYDLYAIASESKIGNNGRWSENSLFFDNRFFGGNYKAVGEICQQIGISSLNFSKLFDFTMKERTKNLKGNVLIKIIKPSKEYQKTAANQFYKVDSRQPLDFELPDDADLEGQRIDWELQVDRQRQTKQNRIVDQIVDKLEKNYQSKLSNFQKFVVHQCGESCSETISIEDFLNKTKFPAGKKISFSKCALQTPTCTGGFGDRIRGFVTAFYFAVATDRIFQIDWLPYPGVQDYFEINNETHFRKMKEKQNDGKIFKFFRDSGWTKDNPALEQTVFVEKFASKDFQKALEESDVFLFDNNRWNALEALFLTPKYHQKLIQVLGRDLFYSGPIDFKAIITAGLRTLLRKPEKKMQEIVENAIENEVGKGFWQEAVKFGVQLRFHGGIESGARADGYFKCFQDELGKMWKIRTDGNRTKPVVVFVTVSLAEEETMSIVGKLVGKLPKLDNLKVFWTGTKQNLTYSHVLLGQSNATNDKWMAMAKSYIDWYLLTRMDYLIISRSSFGESAAFMGNQFTRRFMHTRSNKELCVFDSFYDHLYTLLVSGQTKIYDLI